MKTVRALILTCLVGVMATGSYAQNATEVAAMVNSKNFYFDMQTVTSMAGRTRTMPGEYFIRMSGDSLVSDLPYFGQAYSASFDPSELGVKFTSKKFTYAVTQKKNRWDITIKPKDADDVQSLFFSIYDNATASLQVSSNNKQSISYMGNIKSN